MKKSASTRQFRAGRTETGRTLTNQLVKFVHLMETKSVSAEMKREALLSAADAHVKYLKSAVKGHGVDRHLLGLKILAGEMGVTHKFLTDEAQSISTHWRLR